MGGVPYWDTGVPGLVRFGRSSLSRLCADPFNDLMPVDSAAAAIAAPGLLRWKKHLDQLGGGRSYWHTGLRITQSIRPKVCILNR